MASGIGVVVIGRNEGQRLERCLRSLMHGADQVLYVDSGSCDGSPQLARSLGVEVLALDMGQPFTAARARNEGFAALQQLLPSLRLVQFVDGDCEVAAGWLAVAQAFLDSHPDVAVVCGRRRERFPERSVYNLLCELEWDTPIGEAKACGGDALMRADAFAAAGGFCAGLIAGEEPELCVRLRAQGWKIWRLDAEMTLHDAAISRFSQWWRRSLRAGHAYAEGAYLHGRAPERHWLRESRRAWVWGLGIPVATLLACLALGSWGLLLLLVYPLQVVRLARRGGRSARQNWLQAVFLVLGKFPEMLGQLRFLQQRFVAGTPALIEYKQEGPWMLGTIVKSVFTLQPGYSLRALNNKYRLMGQIARQWPQLNAFVQRMRLALGEARWRRLGVDCIGVVQWPYISRCWEAPQRLEVVASHFEVVAGQFPALLLLERTASQVVCELSNYSPGCRLVLDRPIWFKREGELVLNLFRNDLRVASLAFTLCRSQGELCLFIGAVQGIHKGVDSATSLAIYRDLTKDFEGLRPRSLLLEALKCLARTLRVVHLYAVRDACRHHRHAYFGHDKGEDLVANYDAIWQEHGAIASERADFFALPMAPVQRANEDIPSKKRAMYRRRQVLLEDVFARLQAALAGNGHNLGLQEKQGDAPDQGASAGRQPPVVDSLK